MPAYKEENGKTWYAQFFYVDWTGKRKRKKKRGFATKREAKEYEDNFLTKPPTNEKLTFQQLYSSYISDISVKFKESTLETKMNIFETHILPYFKNRIVSEISSSDIRMWQNEILKKGYAKTYQKTINNQISSIFNYAIKHHGLVVNPCHIAGSIGEKRADEMQYWTLDEFNLFISYVKEPGYHIAFMLLHYGGLRKGELTALTPNDINKDENSISINKTASFKQGDYRVTEPKTKQSKRIVTIPKSVYEELKNYIDSLYGIRPTDRIFHFNSNHTLNGYLDRKIKEIGNLKKIRIHDFRHSHVALCIDMGINILLISKRLGHKDIETTLNLYGHLYPDKQRNLADKLEEKIQQK